MIDERRKRIPEGLEAMIRPSREREDVAGVLPEPSVGPARRKCFRSPDRVAGLLLGCAVGDALGMPVSGLDNDQTLRALRRLGGIRDFLAPQPHVMRSLRKLRPGCWTDDTQLILAITRSLVREGCIDHDAIADAHVRAFENFELRGWDATTKQACRRLAQGTNRARSGKLGGAANAVAAKIAPIAALSFGRGESREELLHHCLALGIMTHHDRRSVTGAYLIALLIRDALASPRKWEPEPERYDEMIDEARWAEEKLVAFLEPTGDPISQHLDELSDALDSDPEELAELSNGATRHVCNSIPFIVALLCSRPLDFEQGVLATVNAGGDTDTNGAIVGAVLGAAFGARKIPRRFADKLEEAEIIRETATEFARLFGE